MWSLFEAKPDDLSLSTYGCFIFFLSNLILFLLIRVYHYYTLIPSYKHASKVGKKAVIQQHSRTTAKSKPLDFTFYSFHDLSKHFVQFSLCLTLCYICEHYPIFDHTSKEYNRDFFFFICGVIVLTSLFTIEKTNSTDVLSRDQTEEWKGWMQIVFLLYHYFHANEVYNSVRVMITCYVWMTGFGNFSFFYIKQDFSMVRLLQMFWRLNFLVGFLCLVMDNTYILYYICPLHTFYFFLTFGTMWIGDKWNRSKWGIRFKLFCVGCLIYLVWDYKKWDLFSLLWGPFLSTTPTIGATSGTLWEWYFRSSLDHWSTFFGMIFALNFPMLVAWYAQVEKKQKTNRILCMIIKGIPSIIMICLFVHWVNTYFWLPKLEYNQTNSYFALIPLLAYIFLRNVSLTFRGYHLSLFHSVGKTTLESYLMQHHIWLTSNAKTLLTIAPGYPKVNFLVCSILFMFISRNLYRLTLYIRGIILPNELINCIKNLVGLFVILGTSYILAFILREVEAGWTLSLFATISYGLVLLGAIDWFVFKYNNNDIIAMSKMDYGPLKQHIEPQVINIKLLHNPF